MITKNVLEEAQLVVTAAAEKVDPRFRLGYHIAPPANWMNDPNGLVYFKGEYHVFYQHHPYSADWGPMHWGHVKSTDLVHWEHLPIALAPSEEYDRDGCFSGSAVDDNGVLTLIYTGNIFIDQEKDILDQNQSIAVSEDGIYFSKVPQNPVIPVHPPEGSGHFRDPKVWRHNDTWYMVVGSRTEDSGMVLLYQSADLREWTYVTVLAQSEGGEGYMWECPDFFELDGHHVLLFSPQGIDAQGEKYLNRFQTGYITGTFDYETHRFERGSFTEMDHGHDFYAVQTLLDDKGRRIAIGWMDMWESAMPTKEDGWAGALTLPRELRMTADGVLTMTPVEELQQLRIKSLPLNLGELHDETVQTDIREELLELQISFSLEDVSASSFGLSLRSSKDGAEKTVIQYDVQERTLRLDRSSSGEGVDGVRSTKVQVQGNTLDLHLYLDRSSLEVFANQGHNTMTSRIYPGPDSLGLSFFAEGGSVSIIQAEAWLLKDVWIGEGRK